MKVNSQRSPIAEGSFNARPRPEPILVLVTDPSRLGGRALGEVVREAVDGGVTAVQLRDKSASYEELLRTGRDVREVIAGRAHLIVNTDVDAAIALDAAGIHLPEDGPPTAGVRARVGHSMRISRAVHSVEAAIRAERDGADVVQAGTLFPTRSKSGAPTLGLDRLRAICDAVHIPVIAIGGITPSNAAAALGTGAAGIAVIGAIFDAEQPAEAAAALRAAMTQAVMLR